jgi:hypothetical protein
MKASASNAALGPPVEALIDDLPVAKALGQIAPRDVGAKPEENGLDEQAIVRRRAAHMAFTARKNVFDPIPLVVAVHIVASVSPSSGRPLMSQTKLGAPSTRSNADPSRGTPEQAGRNRRTSKRMHCHRNLTVICNLSP